MKTWMGSYGNVNSVPMQSMENQRSDPPASWLSINQSQLISDHEYFKNIPIGYRFHPTDEEITEYLMKKVCNEPLPRNRIHEVNLYDFNPEVLAENFTPCGENEWYFFTPREKKYKNGRRPKRNAGDGYWKATGADKHIMRNSEKISSKKALLYYKGRPPGGMNTCWMMHEYTLSNPPAPVRTSQNSMRLDDWVLCRVVKKAAVVKKSEKKGNEDEQHAGPGNSRRMETDNIVDEQAEEENIGQDTTLRIPMEASEEPAMPAPCMNQAQVPDIFTYNQPQNVDSCSAFSNPADAFYYSMGYQSFNSTPMNQQAGMSSEYPYMAVPRMCWKLQHSLQGNYFAGYNCPYFRSSPEISDLMSRSQEPLASVSGSDDGSHQVSVSHEIPAPASMIQGEYPSSQNQVSILTETAQYSLSNKIPGPISWQQEVDSSNPNPAPVHHEFSGPTFQGLTEGPLPEIPAPAADPIPGSLEEEFPGIMGLDTNEAWDLDFLSSLSREAPDQWPQPDPKWKNI
ncbi:NAC domain-containing protein 1 [Sesamum angolense]|uniref:NAC domain-containing protein 1 n=1 Tax=Sesamum angolense TaxID=2727404 RepID=A0AAE2BP86_9LAMI|nr:NAC domain-containing protein 1 [Sesamum angolense]